MRCILTFFLLSVSINLFSIEYEAQVLRMTERDDYSYTVKINNRGDVAAVFEKDDTNVLILFDRSGKETIVASSTQFIDINSLEDDGILAYRISENYLGDFRSYLFKEGSIQELQYNQEVVNINPDGSSLLTSFDRQTYKTHYEALFADGTKLDVSESSEVGKQINAQFGEVYEIVFTRLDENGKIYGMTSPARFHPMNGKKVFVSTLLFTYDTKTKEIAKLGEYPGELNERETLLNKKGDILIYKGDNPTLYLDNKKYHLPIYTFGRKLNNNGDLLYDYYGADTRYSRGFNIFTKGHSEPIEVINLVDPLSPDIGVEEIRYLEDMNDSGEIVGYGSFYEMPVLIILKPVQTASDK